MPATAINAVGLSNNVAPDISTLGATADTVNFNSFPNNGRTLVLISTGATPGTVSIVVTGTVDGRTVTDVPVLDGVGGALAANKTYIFRVGKPADYGDVVTIKATNASTRIIPIQMA